VLANLYGSEDDFIKEYHTNLANKFINYKSNILEEEIKNIELLKQRFGENHLNICMIIIKDVKESHKIS
jgi:anaphase-promoting complex subunit 2